MDPAAAGARGKPDPVAPEANPANLVAPRTSEVADPEAEERPAAEAGQVTAAPEAEAASAPATEGREGKKERGGGTGGRWPAMAAGGGWWR